MHTILRTCAICLACLLGGPLAHAICAIGITPKIWVGDVATNSQCGANTIQAAIDAATCPNTQIILSAGHVYNEQHLTIVNKSVALVGNAGVCGVDPVASTAPVRTISGIDGASVIAIGGNSDVMLQYVEIAGATESSGSKGAGIFFGGSGSLTLEATTVDHNAADYGGGIAMSPSGSATLTLLDNVYVINNAVLHDGGGIRIEGDTSLFMLANGTDGLQGSTVSLNHALNGYGGGIEVLGPAIAYIGTSGNVAGAVFQNTAKFGGGIALIATSAGPASAELFSTNAALSVDISNNTATSQGGGVYLLGDGNDGTGATLCAQDFRIDGNSAPDGSAIFANNSGTDASDFAEDIAINADECTPVASLGAVSCAANTPCNEISGNSGVDSNNNPIGSAINLSAYDQMYFNRVSILQNTGTQIFNLNSGGQSYLTNCLIADNQATSQVILSQQNFNSLLLFNCTVANNTIDDGPVISATAGLNLSNDLFFEDFVTLDYQQGDTSQHGDCAPNPNCLFVQYIVSQEIESLEPANFTIQSTTPRFVDDSNSDISKRNYRLTAFVQEGEVAASTAMDFAPSASPVIVPYSHGNDLGNNSRGQDVPLVPNRFGASDVGAYEMQPIPTISDRIFADRFGDATSLVF